MNTTSVQIVLGRNLSEKDLKSINLHRKKEFQSTSDINPKPENDDWDKPYFLFKNSQNKLLGFGRLHYLNIKFRDKIYPILGIATLVAIEKSKGYGRLIVERMKIFSTQKKMTSIGFCDPEDTPFYTKCGLGVIVGMDRFVFPNGPKNTKPGDIIYIDGDEGLIQKILTYPNEKIFSSRDEW